MQHSASDEDDGDDGDESQSQPSTGSDYSYQKQSKRNFFNKKRKNKSPFRAKHGEKSKASREVKKYRIKMISRNRIHGRCPSYLVPVDNHSNLNLSNDAAMYSPGVLHSIARNNLMNSISSNSVAVGLSGETEKGVEQKFIVHTIDHDYEFKFLEIEHIGECAEVSFNANAWFSVIAGNWITQHLGLRTIQGIDSFRIFN